MGVWAAVVRSVSGLGAGGIKRARMPSIGPRAREVAGSELLQSRSRGEIPGRREVKVLLAEQGKWPVSSHFIGFVGHSAMRGVRS
jgi:hypothetical protein